MFLAAIRPWLQMLSVSIVFVFVSFLDLRAILDTILQEVLCLAGLAGLLAVIHCYTKVCWCGGRYSR